MLSFNTFILLGIGVLPRPDSTLYQQSLIRDLTGDGIADTITLVVTGASLDSGFARLEIRSWTLLYQDTWPTARYTGEGAGGPFASTSERHTFIRRELAEAVAVKAMNDTFLSEVDAADQEEFRNAPYVVLLHRGYENDEMIAWSAKRQSFVTMWGCC